MRSTESTRWSSPAVPRRACSWTRGAFSFFAPSPVGERRLTLVTHFGTLRATRATNSLESEEATRALRSRRRESETHVWSRRCLETEPAQELEIVMRLVPAEGPGRRRHAAGQKKAAALRRVSPALGNSRETRERRRPERVRQEKADLEIQSTCEQPTVGLADCTRVSVWHLQQ